MTGDDSVDDGWQRGLTALTLDDGVDGGDTVDVADALPPCYLHAHGALRERGGGRNKETIYIRHGMNVVPSKRRNEMK